MDVTRYLPPAWVWWIVGAAVTVAASVFAWVQLRRVIRAAIAVMQRNSFDDNLTIIAAAIATGVSATGMWKFAGDVLHLWWPLRIVLFAFIEVAIVTSAVRAKRSMRENFKAGVDGIAVWVLACLTAVLSSLDAASFGEAVFRLAAPLVAAWLWERGMAIERHRIRGTGRINWRLTPERVLVRLGLAEASDRTAGEVDAHRRITRVALAAKRVHQLRAANASARKVRKAAAKLDQRLDQAVAHTGLARDDRMKWALLDQVSTLGGAEQLCTLLETATGPWAMTDHPLVTGAAKHHEAVRLAGAMQEWADALNKQTDPETSSAIKSMAAYIAQLEGRPIPQFETPDETRAPVDDQVDVQVSQADIDELINSYRENPDRGPDETRDETADETRATDAMWAYWQQIVEVERRIPTGAELAAAGGCSPQYGARKAKEWLAAMDGRTRRALQPGKRNGS